MNKFGLITARDLGGISCHDGRDTKVLNDLTTNEWAIIIGGDSHTRMSKGVPGADSGTVALALATGEVHAHSRVGQSDFQGRIEGSYGFSRRGNATQAQMLKKFGDNEPGQNHRSAHWNPPADQAFTLRTGRRR